MALVGLILPVARLGLLALVATFFSMSSVAQENERTRELSRAGEMFTLRYVPGSKKITIGVVGSPKGGVNWSDASLEAFLIRDSKAVPLTLQRHGSKSDTEPQVDFVHTQNLTTPAELRVKIDSDGKKETLSLPVP